MAQPKPVVLILCTGNSCRSQMAEGYMRAIASERFAVHSAGSQPAGFVHPLAIQVMAEVGIDLRAHRSKSLAEFLPQPIDTLITVCAHADQACPQFASQIHRLHWPLADPAQAQGSLEHRLDAFRRVRDEIHARINAFLKVTANPPTDPAREISGRGLP